MDVEEAFTACAGGGFRAGAGHGDAFLAGVAPAGGEGEIERGLAGNRELAEAFELRGGAHVGDAGDGGLGIEEGGDAAAELGSGAEGFHVLWAGGRAANPAAGLRRSPPGRRGSAGWRRCGKTVPPAPAQPDEILPREVAQVRLRPGGQLGGEEVGVGCFGFLGAVVFCEVERKEAAESVAEIIWEDSRHITSIKCVFRLLLTRLYKKVSCDDVSEKLRTLTSEEFRFGLPVDPASVKGAVDVFHQILRKIPTLQ